MRAQTAQAYAKDLARTDGRVFVPPFDDPDVIAGQGTVGMEILRQMASDKELHAIFVPVRTAARIASPQRCRPHQPSCVLSGSPLLASMPARSGTLLR